MFKYYKSALIIVSVAIGLRLLLAILFYAHSGWDYDNFVAGIKHDGYYEIAVNLVNNGIFAVSGDLGSTSLRTPGYPLLLASFLYFFGNIWLFLGLQIIIGGFIPLLGRKLCWEITGLNRVAEIVAWFLALEPVGVFLSSRLLSETIFTFFFLLAFLWLIKLIKSIKLSVPVAAVAAVFLATATLIRPTTIYLPLVLVLFWCAYSYWRGWRIAVKPILAFLLIFILILTPWFYRNYRVFGQIGFSSIHQQGFYMLLAPSILAVKNHEDFSQSSKKFFQAEGFNDSLPINIDRGGRFTRRALEVVAHYPRELLIVSGITLLSFFTHDGALDLLRGFNLVPTGIQKPISSLLRQPPAEAMAAVATLIPSPYVFVLIMRIIWFLVALGLVVGAVQTVIKKSLNPIIVLTWVCIVYFALTSITIGFAVNARFRFPINALILTLALSFFYTLLMKRFKRERPVEV